VGASRASVCELTKGGEGKEGEYVLQHICAQHALSSTVQMCFKIRAAALSLKVFCTLS